MAENISQNPSTPAPGGFLHPNLPSPAPSLTSPGTSGLPHPRSRPLPPGSAKEDTVRNYIENAILHINRRYVKKFALKQPDDEVVGYSSMAELCNDLDSLTDVIWKTGTPSLQIPYLLNIASEFNTWVPAFPPSPKATLGVLHKLDHCFASLLSGEDIDTKETLPGFENGMRAGMSKTDMVRCKSTVQHTRMVVAEVLSHMPGDEDEDDEDEKDEDMDGVVEAGDATESGAESTAPRLGDWDDDLDALHMDVARVYEITLVKLGETMGEGGGGVGEVQISDD